MTLYACSLQICSFICNGHIPCIILWAWHILTCNFVMSCIMVNVQIKIYMYMLRMSEYMAISEYELSSFNMIWWSYCIFLVSQGATHWQILFYNMSVHLSITHFRHGWHLNKFNTDRFLSFTCSLQSVIQLRRMWYSLLYHIQNECDTASHYHTLLWLKNVIKNVRNTLKNVKNVSKT